MHHNFVSQLTDILKKQHVLSESQATSIKNSFQTAEWRSFQDFLLDDGLVERPQLLKALSEYYGVASFDAQGYFFDHTLVRNFPKEFLLQQAVIPLTTEAADTMMVFVAAHPHDELRRIIEQYGPWTIRFMVGIRRDIDDAIKEFYDKSLTELNPDEDEDIDDSDKINL